VFVFGGVDVFAELVGRFPELFFEGFLFGGGFWFCHEVGLSYLVANIKTYKTLI
jgi:hypothetical protein